MTMGTRRRIEGASPTTGCFLVHAITVILTAAVLVGCEAYELDKRMEELCKRDGGLHVYQTVTLPAEMFDQNGDPFPGWRRRPAERRLGSEFDLREEVIYLKRGDPMRGQGRLQRFRWSVIRLRDGKMMGEATVYGRSGGDLIVIDHFSSKMCPDRLGLPSSLINAVFLKEAN